MWLYIWILVSLFVLGIYVWSLVVLYQQKKAWAAYAKKAKLKYEGGSLLSPPLVKGMLNGRKVAFFTDNQPTKDVRGQRFVTVLEFDIGPGMATGAAIASKEFESFLSGLRLNETFKPPYPDWDESYIIKTRDAVLAQQYLTQERARILHALFKLKNSIALFFFDELEAVLRVETSDPLRNAGQMEKVINKMLAAIKALEPTEAEKSQNEDRRLMAEMREKERLLAELQERKRQEEEKKKAEQAVPLAPEPDGSTNTKK